jgi:arylamine N-acetyltransferase
MPIFKADAAGVDIADYFNRVEYNGSAGPTLETLRDLVCRHTRSIPFENVDSLLGRPVADLSPQALTGKLVRRRRGGYCYEQNGLMGYVLAELGFGVDHIGARVVWPNGVDVALPAMNHNALAITVPGVDGRFLVDVGFGGPTPTAPLRCELGALQQTPHGTYQLLAYGDRYLLQARVRCEWQPLYIFTFRPQPRVDLEVGSWYMSTYPTSIMVANLMVAIVTDDARVHLRGRELAIHRRDDTERLRLDSTVEVIDSLANRFGIDLDDLGDPAAVRARLGEVLDS